MELEFYIDDYLLMWELLFTRSFSNKFNNYKTKLWKIYNSEYKKMYDDKNKMLNDLDNYIPDDDTIYNILEDTVEYKNIIDYVEKYKISIISVWDKYKKDINKNLKRILKRRLPLYKVLIVYDKLNMVEVVEVNNVNYIILGKHFSNPISIIYDILYVILKQEYSKNTSYFNTIVAMVINELSTTISNKSLPYLATNQDNGIKTKIYPYFLMYLGISKKDVKNYMKKDNVFFDENRYIYNYDLSRIDIYDFIEYVNNNINDILSNNDIDIM